MKPIRIMSGKVTVNVFGKIIGDLADLKQVKAGDEISVEKVN